MIRNKFIRVSLQASLIILFLILLTPEAHVSNDANYRKDPWPLIIRDNLNWAIIGTYGEHRDPGHYHLAIDIQSKVGEPVFNNRDGILLECIKIHDGAGYRIIIGDPVTLEGREFTHVYPTRQMFQRQPGRSFVPEGEIIGAIADYGNIKADWNDHLHYGYVRIQQAVNIHGYVDNVIEGIENPLNRLEIPPQLRDRLRDTPPQLASPIMFIPDGGRIGDFRNNVVFGNVDIVVHAFDKMGRGFGLGDNAPAPYEFEWRIVHPAGFKNFGGKLLMDGRIPLIRPRHNAIYTYNNQLPGNFKVIITNTMTENGYWMTNESRSNPGQPARNLADAKFPDGYYTIEVIIREHPALGRQRESRFQTNVTIYNFPYG